MNDQKKLRQNLTQTIEQNKVLIKGVAFVSNNTVKGYDYTSFRNFNAFLSTNESDINQSLKLLTKRNHCVQVTTFFLFNSLKENEI